MINLLKRVNDIHSDCHRLCLYATNKFLPVAGNIGIFCQSEEEYKAFKEGQQEIVKPSDNPNQKYFEQKEPIVIEKTEGIPQAIYTYLYIRKFDPTPYGKNKGDIDFVMAEVEYEAFKQDVLEGKTPKGVELYDRRNWDTVQITDPAINSVAYISTKEFSEKVRVKFD